MLTDHQIHLRTRYDECDPMGFVHHSNYLKYFEIARTELFRASGGNYREFEQTGLFVVVVRVDCRYHKPARYDDQLVVSVKIDRQTEAKIEQSYRVERADALIVSATVTLAVIDRNGTLQRIPDCLRLI